MRIHPLAAPLLALSAALALACPTLAAPAADAGAAFDAYLRQKLDPGTTIAVESLTLVRDAARFRLDRGVVTFAGPVEGRVWAAVFSGDGRFTFTPPVAFERNELRRFLRTGSVERHVAAVVFLFADSTGEELARGRVRADAQDTRAQEHLDWYLEAIGDPRPPQGMTSLLKPLWLHRALAQPLLDGAPNGAMFAEIVGDDDERLFLEIDPTSNEPVSLSHVPKVPFLVASTLRERERVCQFPRGGVYDTLAYGDLRPDLHVNAYRIDATIGSGLGLTAVAELDARAAVDGQSWIWFSLEPHLLVDSVSWAGSGPAAFLRSRDSQVLWVRTPAPTTRGERVTLRIAYHGATLSANGDWILLRDATGWYPEPCEWVEATFDVTMRHPASRHLVCSAEQVDETSDGKVTTSRWAVRRPSHNVTFVIGDYRQQSFGEADTPPVQALMLRGRPSHLSMESGGRTWSVGSQLREPVVKDLVNAVRFYQERLGPAMVPGFMVAQIPSGHGEAFPGLINIPETAFPGNSPDLEDQVFRTHELAHQWWGYGVGPRTYHDHWLLEGFAEFTSLWYLQAGLGHGRDYLTLLDEWAQLLHDDQQVRPERGRLPGPVWLGSRNASKARPYDYALIDYTKGAWVLHMLRTMMMDLDTGDDARFAAMMRDFYVTYAGRKVDTEQFRSMAEKHAGQPLDWFFDEWVYQTGIPVFEFASRKVIGDDGGTRIRCRVRTKGVPAGFSMPVVMKLVFPNDQYALIRRTVTAPECEFDLTKMPLEPSSIVFNESQSVLGRVKAVEW